jgi:serine/threonine-protein kinase
MPYAHQLGRYQLLDRIAFGGMAEIFRAKTFDRDGVARMVAVKRVLGHLTTDEEFIKMLVDEAKLSAMLDHDNIARVYEFAHHGDEYFIAMEYVDGKDVRALLERHRRGDRRIPAEHVAWIAMEVAAGLQVAHAQRGTDGRALHIVHRDVSPSNVLLSYNGEVKLCDFGIAKATLTRVQTKTGVIKGKVKYMSPEQAMGRRLDHRSDLFSLGTVMYEMLTGQAPFVAPGEVELIFAVRDASKVDAGELNRELPEELNAIVNRLMLRSRSQRFQSGRDLQLALRHFLDEYKPGYRRSHFGRFMRRVFADDIDRELRALEEYVIKNADPSDVGENLIADALPANAPYASFNASSSGGTRVGSRSSRLRARRGAAPDLHAEQTRLFNPEEHEARRLRERETRLLHRSTQRTLNEQSTGRVLPALRLHEAKTQIIRRPERKKPPDDDEDEETPLPLSDDDLEPV